MKAPDSPRAELNRIRWRCRRGMLELDAWLNRFVDTGYAGLDGEDRLSFSRLLDQDDGLLFAWLTGQAEPPAEFRRVLDKIRTNKVDSS